MNLINKIKKIFTDKETLEDIIPLVIMEIKTSLLTEANQLCQFNADIGTCTVAEAEAVTCSEEALAVLKEAKRAATNALRERFPSVPEAHPQRVGIKI